MRMLNPNMSILGASVLAPVRGLAVLGVNSLHSIRRIFIRRTISYLEPFLFDFDLGFAPHSNDRR